MSDLQHPPRPDQARKDWLNSLKIGDEVTVVGMGRKRLATVIMRLDYDGLLITGGVVFDGSDGEDARRDFWIIPVEKPAELAP